MVKPIPDNVKAILNELTAAQQVVLRSYIASLRSDLVAQEEAALNRDAAPHAHYHGHELCTADHGHGEHDEKEHHEHKHTEHCDHKEEEHDHKHHDHHHHHEEDHEHKHTEHCEHEHKHTEHCEHEHEHQEHHDHHEHKHHHHDAKKEEAEIPAWKKAALTADPSAAPFGGDWHSESNISAKSDAMQEE